MIMQFFVNSVPVCGDTVPLGVQGENLATQITADVSGWLAQWPDGQVIVRLIDANRQSHLADTVVDDGTLVWIVTAADTALGGYGVGVIELVQGDVVKKSEPFATRVITDPQASGQAPEPVPGWVEETIARMEELEAGAAQSADDAQTSAGSAQTGAQSAQAAADQAAQSAEDAAAVLPQVETAGAAQVTAIQAAGQQQTQAVTAAGAQQVSAVQTEGADQRAAIETAGAAQVNAIQAEGQTQQTAIQQKGADTLASIPADYTELSGDVADLKSQVNDVYIGKPLVEIGINKLNPSEIEAGIKINDDGSETADSTMDSTGFIELDTTKTSVAFTGLNSGGTARVCLPIIHILFFAADKTTIISHSWYIPSRTVVEIPTNAVYTRMSVGHDHMTGRQPMVEFVDSTSEISPIYVAYNEVVERSHGLNYLDETQQAILGRLDDVEEEVAEIDVVSDQVDANTTAIADILGTSQTIDKLAAFTNGGIRSTTGEFVGSYTYRVATPNIATLAKNITVTIETGFRLYAARFINGVFQSAGWVSSGTEFDAGSEVRLMVARTTEDQSEVADVDLFCSKVTYTPDGGLSDITEQLNENTEAIANNNAVITYGITWDWWITCNSVDTFGNAYIGYVDTDGYAGIIRRQPDGAMQYKRLEKLANDDDHNACATMVLDDGRILVIGSYGHTVNNHIICWRSVNPYSIDEMEKLSFDIPQTGGYTYKTCYSQVIKYNGKLFDFMRFGSIPSGSSSGTYGFACLISTDNGSTWTPYKVFNGTDAYNSIAQCTDDEKYIKIIVANNPAAGANTFRGCYIDLSTYAIYDLSDSQIGTMVPLDNGPITDSSCAQNADMTALIPQTQSGLMGRLFFTAQAPKANTVFLYATALDTAGTDFEYKRYADGTITELGNSGVGFGNVHYISGACFGKDIDTIYYAKATTAVADGPHELHKVKVANNAVSSDDIITEASMCVLRPLFLGNGELATVVGHYNDQNSDGTYNGSFTAWELKPLFTDA